MVVWATVNEADQGDEAVPSSTRGRPCLSSRPARARSDRLTWVEVRPRRDRVDAAVSVHVGPLHAVVEPVRGISQTAGDIVGDGCGIEQERLRISGHYTLDLKSGAKGTATVRSGHYQG